MVPPGEEEEEAPVLIPPPELQTIVDKMASYVARNGRTFEEVVKNKDKKRFSFLFKEDKHHSYYLHKLKAYTTGNYDPKLVPEPVNFKVKKTEEKEPALETPSALPVEDSPENGEEEGDGDDGIPLPPGEAAVLKAEPKIYQQEEEKKRLVDETKLKDKLAAAAREKMILTAKEKAMQLERKRKAATFLAQLAEKKTTVSSVQPVEVEDGELPVGSWPPLAPPGPPQLVIPTLAAPVVIQSSGSDSSDDERSRRKRKKESRKRSRSRSRHSHKKRSKRRSRSRSSRRSKKDKRSKRRRRSRSPRRRRSTSSSSGIEEIRVPDSPPSASTSNNQTKENTPSFEEGGASMQPALDQMKEDLRAKVRAMLGSTS